MDWRRLSKLLIALGGLVLLLAPAAVAAVSPIEQGSSLAITESTSHVSTTANPEASVRLLQIGLSGSIETDIITADLTGDGNKEVLLGTSRGLYILSSGTLVNYIPTSSPIVDVALPGDVTGDGLSDIVLAVGDTYFPNIRCYDGTSLNKVWDFVPKQEVFIENLMWTEQQTLTFDLEVADLNSDNIKDVIATSGYRVYALDGRTGKQLWNFEATNNLWRVVATPDLDADGTPDLAVGGQNGFMYVLSGTDGASLWQKRVVEKCDVVDEEGDIYATVERSVWDIMPLHVQGGPKAVVSSEDGKIRLIDLKDGTIEWETQVVEYVESLLYEYYSQKWKKPTSPGDYNFFNLRLSPVPGITGQGIKEILASSYTGQRRGGEQEARRSGLFLIRIDTGRVLWKNIGLSLEGVAQIEVTSLEGKRAILLPAGKSGSEEIVEVIDLEDGTTLETIRVRSSPESLPWNEYSVKKMDDNSFLLASDYGDVICASFSGEVLWDYPRITGVAVERGDFVGDETTDILIRSETYPGGNREFPPICKTLYLIDGATHEKAWSYKMPYEELVTTGGISDILVTPDLNGDGKQDIAGFIQPLGGEGNGELGEDSKIVLFSGRDGAILLNQPVIEETYYGAWEELYKDPSSLERKLRQQYEQDLQRQLDQIENDMRQRGAPAEEIEQHLAEEERGNREYFEQIDLPIQLTDWQDRLEEERKNRVIDKWIYSLDIMRWHDGGFVFVVGAHRDVFVISPEGKLLWTKSYEPWTYEDPFTGEEHPEMVLRLITENPWQCRYRTVGDLNGDGTDDLVVFGHQEIVVGLSQLKDGQLDFKRGQNIKLESGMDPRQGKLVDDLDGDGIKEILYLRHQENRAPVSIFVSPASGKKLLEIEDYNPQHVTLDMACADFDGDQYADTLLFQRWLEGKEGPKLTVISGRARNAIWDFSDYKEDRLFGYINYSGPIMPAAPIADISGDGIPDLALVKNLTWQPGAQVSIYDIVQNRIITEVVIEETDPRKHLDRRWHPGLLVKEVADFNGDGCSELAVIMTLGDTAEKKEFRLIVVDIHNEQVIADFRVFGSDFIDLGRSNEFGVVGVSGEVYFLDVANNLQITSPAAGSSQTSPLKAEWTGVAPGAYNQVFLDGIEVGRTNENALSVTVALGEHELTIRSLDEFGRGIYRTVKFRVEKESSAATWAIIFLVVLVIVALWVPLSRLVVAYRRRRVRHA